MAVRLEGTTKRFIGLSSDPKPSVGIQQDGATLAASDLPPGSSFFETDTGYISRWNGATWQIQSASDESLLNAVRSLQLEIAALRLGMVVAGACKEVSANDAQSAMIA